jgi:hypothetical protein
MQRDVQSTGIVFKSKPLEGLMPDAYFDLATPRHFWCRRRFEVMQKIAGKRMAAAKTIAEIGCGNGVLRRQVEDAWPHLSPDGFDLNLAGLHAGMATRGTSYCYDIHDRAPEFRQAYDALLMFDVLEHIEREDAFLQSARFHLAPGGALVLNVPALQWLYSPYDRDQGHHRRYSIRQLEEVGRRNGFRVTAATYWGGSLVPIAALRKITLTLRGSDGNSYSTGFDPGSEFTNAWLYRLSGCEFVPQRIAGTSVMAVFEIAG